MSNIGMQVKKALKAMLNDGEFFRIAKAQPEKYNYYVKDFADSLVEAETHVSNNLGKGIEGLSMALLLGVIGENEPVLASAISYMLISANDDDSYEDVKDIIAEAMSFACEPEAPYSKNSEHVKQYAERIRKAVEE